LSLPADLLDRTDRLRQLRNPFTHRKAPDHPHSFGARFQSEKRHPRMYPGRGCKAGDRSYV
jgi:hypothetical protein